MNKQLKLWVDDIRDAPYDSWHIARTPWDALVMLSTNQYSMVSLDHDLNGLIGNKELTGKDILLWLIQRHNDGYPIPDIIRVHTANPVGRKDMIDLLKRYIPTHTDER